MIQLTVDRKSVDLPTLSTFTSEHSDQNWRVVRMTPDSEQVAGAVHWRELPLPGDHSSAILIDAVEMYALDQHTYGGYRTELLRILEKEHLGALHVLRTKDYCPPYHGIGYYKLRRTLATHLSYWSPLEMSVWESTNRVREYGLSVVALLEGEPAAVLVARQTAAGKVQGTRVFGVEYFLASPLYDQELLRSTCFWAVQELWGK